MKAKYPSDLVRSRNGVVRDRDDRSEKPTGDALGFIVRNGRKWTVQTANGQLLDNDVPTMYTAKRILFAALKKLQ